MTVAVGDGANVSIGSGGGVTVAVGGGANISVGSTGAGVSVAGVGFAQAAARIIKPAITNNASSAG